MPAEYFQQYQVKAEAPFGATLTPLIPLLESTWHQPWSEPVRFRISPRLKVVLSASGLFAPVLNPGTQIIQFFESRWHYPWSEPVRVRLRLRAGANLFSSLPSPVVPNPGNQVQGWYQELRNPVWPKKGLGSKLQQTTAHPPRLLPTPNITVIMQAVETNADVADFRFSVHDDLPPAADLTAVNVAITEIVGEDAVVSIKEDG